MKTQFTIKPQESTTTTVPEGSKPERLDRFLTSYYEDSSRSFFQNLVNSSNIMVNNNPAKASMLVRPGDTITISMPPIEQRTISDETIHTLHIQLLYEHKHFLVISKPAGLVVHQAHKHSKAVTLIDWILYHYKDIVEIGEAERPGIVHRLDKDTSGLMLIARTPYGHAKISQLFKDRMVKKTYTALVTGHPPASGVIDYRIDRHPTDPTKMSAHTGSGRDAKTFYKTIEYYREAALVELQPVTGRTHQIRVHCAAIEHPLLGDTAYGSSSKLIHRHALHASKLSFALDNESFDFNSELPYDFVNAIAALKGT